MSVTEEKTKWESVTVTCDRCHHEVKGMIYTEEAKFKGTAGFYKVDNGWWNKFANPEENIVCDECMFKDPRYQEIYRVRGT